ncbi:MAG: formylglycine-generating enzyme family protein [Magnetococcales bacterium]|nr:formylglycine-generating enzyme family protein [Magnetococcales bacterium]
MKRSLALTLLLCLVWSATLFAAEGGGGEQPPPGGGKGYFNTLGMEFVLLPAGTFLMGSDKNFDNEAFPDEMPQHRVTLTQPFYLGRNEVTQGQWVALMEENPSKVKGRNLPVDMVSWVEVQEFIRRLNVKEKTRTYRLPTEAEWEYACRAGTTTSHYWGNRADEIGLYAWFEGNARGRVHPVGQLRPNAFGLYDMLGNVWELVQDAYGDQAYRKHAAKDPFYEESNANHVYRGGSWDSTSWYARCANRGGLSAEERLESVGFRLARSKVAK